MKMQVEGSEYSGSVNQKKLSKHLKSTPNTVIHGKIPSIYKSHSTNSPTSDKDLLMIETPTFIRSASCDEKPKSPNPLPLQCTSNKTKDKNIPASFGLNIHNRSLSSASR